MAEEEESDASAPAAAVPSGEVASGTGPSLKTDRAFCAFFRSLPPQPDTVRLFERSGFLSAHGADALLLADAYFHSRHAVRVWERTAGGGLPLEYAVVRDGAELHAVVRTLVLGPLAKTIEILSPSSGTGRAWTVTRRASPGCVDQFEEVLDAVARDPPVAAAVAASGASVGIAFAETAMAALGVLEFPDDEQLTNLECALLQLGVRQCFVAEAGDDSNDPRTRRILAVLSRCGVAVSRCPRADFAVRDIEQDLKTLLGDTFINNLPELDHKLAMAALSCIIRRLDLLTGDVRFKLRRVDISRYMRLDHAAIRALDLVKEGGGSGSSGDGSLAGVLDRCITAMGSRRLLRWIKQPLVDATEVSKRLDLVEALVLEAELRERLRIECLKGIADLDRLARRLASPKAGLQDCVVLYDSAERLKPTIAALGEFQTERCKHAEALKAAFMTPLEYAANKLKKFQAMVEQLIDLDKASQEHVYEINVMWDEKLREIDERRKRILTKMESLAAQAAADIGAKTVKLVDMPQHGKVFRITKSEERGLRERGGKRYSALDRRGAGATAGGAGVRFTSAELGELNSKLAAETETYEVVTKEIVKRVLEVARSYLPVVDNVGDCLAELDALLSLAHVSASRGYVRPVVHPVGTGDTRLIACRHPCVEAAANTPDSFVPNYLILSRESGPRFVIVTGPNMGGKSTYIRQAGIAMVMAQMGCFVAAQEASISAVDAVLCRVGAGDSQLRGVSTFMAEMLETATILRVATQRSFIIIDELGRGTSTYDGFGLAWAISEHICKAIGCFCLFATHYHELTALEEKLPFVKNLHVTAQTVAGRLVLQYKVREGACDRSFGIHVAELAGFPQSVVDTAKRKAAELEDFRPRKKRPSAVPNDDDAEAAPSPQPLSMSIAEDEDIRAKNELDAFLQRFATLPLGPEVSDADAVALAQRAVADFVASASPTIHKLLAMASGETIAVAAANP